MLIEAHNIKQELPLEKHATVFQAEVNAIRSCVLQLYDEVDMSTATCTECTECTEAYGRRLLPLCPHLYEEH